MINTERLCMGCMNDNDGEQICPICGFDKANQNDSQCLPIRFEANNRYIVGKVLSTNGEGILYIGWDKATDTIVKIKEYFPAGIAVRNPDTSVSIVPDKKYVFNEGLLEFLEINRKIMSRSLSALQEVNDVFEYNGTAFVVYQNIQGITLADFIKRNGGSLKWEQARALMLPLIDTIKEMNDLGIVHKGISPETVVVGRDGKLRITDYSINKLRIADAEVESNLSEGYAAIEQYGIMDMKPGAYTDVYGFCATLFNVLIGTVVPKATLRLENESMSIPARFAEELPRHVLVSLANGLKVKPQDRTADMEALKNELFYGEMVEPKIAPVKPVEKAQATATTKKKSGSSAKYLIISASITAAVLVIFLILAFTVFDLFGTKEKETDNNNSTSPTSSVASEEESTPAASESEDTVKKYIVPDFKGKTYAEIEANAENDVFEFTLASKVYSDEYPRGTICEQSIAAGESVEEATKINLIESLGPKEIKMPSVVGKDLDDAKFELMKHGFTLENISVKEQYDTQSAPGAVVKQYPAAGDMVNIDSVVEVYVNTYEGDSLIEIPEDEPSDVTVVE